VSDRPDFRELVGDDLSPEERERLERVHDLLVAAGPPPELPPALADPSSETTGATVSYLPRRRIGLMLGLAAAIALFALVTGYVAGQRHGSFAEDFVTPMHATASGSDASAMIHVGKVDEAGNWPLEVDVSGLPALPKGQYYEMFLSRGKNLRAASCGTFRVSGTSQELRLNAPYRLRAFDGWVVTRERQGATTHPVVLTTA